MTGNRILNYLSWDDEPEEQSILSAVELAADASGRLAFTAPVLESVEDLRAQLLRPAYMTVLSGHGGPHSDGDTPQETELEEWRLTGKAGHSRLTVPCLLDARQLIPASVFVVAACFGRLSPWSKHLRPGAVLIVTTGEPTYPAMKRMLAEFVSRIDALSDDDSAAVINAWDSARQKAAKGAATLLRNNFDFEIAPSEAEAFSVRHHLSVA